MMKKIYTLFAVMVFCVILSTAPIAALESNGYETVVDPLVVNAYIDGSFTPDPALAEPLGIPQSAPVGLQMNTVDFYYEITDPEYLAQGFRGYYYDWDHSAWRVEFTTKIEAPVIDIWQETVESDFSWGGLDLSETPEDLQVGPTESATSERNMGMSFFYGDETYLLENETDDSGASWEYATDFNLATYNILYLDDIGNYLTNNMTVVVSYVETTSYVNLNSTYAYNKTIVNEPVDGYDTYWWRLDLENTNTSFDAYVANIEITNFDVDGGRYILGVDADTTDERYATMYIGDLDTPTSLGLSAEEHFKEKIDPILHTSRDNGLGLSGFWSSATSGNILSAGSSLRNKASNVINEARGWKSSTDLSDSIKNSIVSRSDEVDNRDQVKDMTISKGIMSWGMTQKARDLVKNYCDRGAEIKNSVAEVVADVKEKTVKRVQFATSLVADKVKEAKATAADLKETTLGGIAAAKKKVSEWGTNITDSIRDTAGKIKDGAISVGSYAKKLVEKAANFLGQYWPYILGAVIIIVVLYFYMMSGGAMRGFVPVMHIENSQKQEFFLRRIFRR